MRKLAFLVAGIILFQLVHAQSKGSETNYGQPASLDEIIKPINGDTLLFYYDDYWQLVKPACSTIFRIARVDTALPGFIGRFVDYYSDSTIAAEGNYKDGKKEGSFSLYYPNGQLEQSGEYKNNYKQGIWNYFYENGDKWQVFDFEKNDVRVLDYWDETGKKLVDSGNGIWQGYSDRDEFTEISGAILNGYRNGVWTRAIPSKKLTINIEKFENGRRISGRFNSIQMGYESYKRDTSYCSVEEQPAFVNAEIFHAAACYGASTKSLYGRHNKWEEASYSAGMMKYTRDIENGMANHRNITGKVRVQVTINEDGNITDYVALSSIGLEDQLISVLKKMQKWNPAKLNGKPIKSKLVINVSTDDLPEINGLSPMYKRSR